MLSYVHTKARGHDLNDFRQLPRQLSPSPILRPNPVQRPVGQRVPNRFLAWGSFQLPSGWRVSPVIEYRTRLHPYFSVDAAQQYVGVPNSTRYPAFFSVDSRISKDIKVNPKYTVPALFEQLRKPDQATSFNPEAVHFNTAEPTHGYFFGHRGRRFTADFDVLFYRERLFGARNLNKKVTSF